VVTHDTNLYCLSFPAGVRMQVPVGRHVSVTACIDGSNSASLLLLLRTVASQGPNLQNFVRRIDENVTKKLDIRTVS